MSSKNKPSLLKHNSIESEPWILYYWLESVKSKVENILWKKDDAEDFLERYWDLSEDEILRDKINWLLLDFFWIENQDWEKTLNRILLKDFSKYISDNPWIFRISNNKLNYNSNETNLRKYAEFIVKYLLDRVEIWLEYEPIILIESWFTDPITGEFFSKDEIEEKNKNLALDNNVYNRLIPETKVNIDRVEWLLRVRNRVSKNNYNNWFLINLFKNMWYGFSLFSYVLYIALTNIKKDKWVYRKWFDLGNCPVNINMCLSDLLHPNLIQVIQKFEEDIWIIMKKNKRKLWFEIIEKECPEWLTKRILERTKELEWIWYYITADDLWSKTIWELENEINAIWATNIKIAWWAFDRFYKAYGDSSPYFIEFTHLKNFFTNLIKSWMQIVFEEIDEGNYWLLRFVTEIMWINRIQWFMFTKNPGNIEKLRNWELIPDWTI